MFKAIARRLHKRHRAPAAEVRASALRYRRCQVQQLEDRRLLVLTPGLLADINSGLPASNPADYVFVGANTFFTAESTPLGRELWKSSGTPGGTMLVRDIRTGSPSSDPQELVNVGGTLFFSADDGQTGRELWMSNGTLAGTVRVRDIRPGTPSSNPTNLTNVYGTLFFTADDGQSGTELWRSDGTLAGTFRVRDIRSGVASSDPFNLTPNDAILLFAADDGQTGQELWRSDGTLAGTFRLRDIRSGITGSSPANFITIDETLFFTANDGFTGNELWRSNGTGASTVRVADIRSGSFSSDPNQLTNVNGGLFFVANDGFTGNELWRVDGSPAGASRIRDIRAGTLGSDPQELTNNRGLLYFSADDGITGRELWRSDGSLGGTFRVRDINPGTFSSSPSSLTVIDTDLFFAATTAQFGTELWRSNGTDAGTVLVRDIAAGTFSSNPTQLTNVLGTLAFAANDNITGNELWESNGTLAGTIRTADIRAGAPSSDPANFAVWQGRLYFSADNGIVGREPWQASSAILTGNLLVAATDAGGGGLVRVLDPVTRAELYSLLPFPGFNGGIRVATGDVNADGYPDLITAPGTPGVPRVRVFDGISGNILPGPVGSFLAYGGGFFGGVFVASADFNRDGYADIVTGADAGGGPHVRVFSGRSLGELGNFFPYSVNFTGGVRVAAADLNANGIPDVITAAGPGGGPHVRSFEGASGVQIPGTIGSFFAYNPTFTGGVYVSGGDVNGDGRGDVITGAGAGGGPHVKAFSGINGSELASFFAYDAGFTGGVRVANANINLNSRRDIVTAPGPGGGPHVRAFDLVNGEVANFFPFSISFTGGVFVSGSPSGVSGAPLVAESRGHAAESAGSVSSAELEGLRAAAVSLWRDELLDTATIGRLNQLDLLLADLPGSQLGAALHDTILLDFDAADHGWFVDLSPDTHEEFQTDDSGRRTATSESAAADRIDLLTVLAHEMGHALGLDHADQALRPHDVMAAELAPGQRRLPAAGHHDAVLAGEW